MSKNLEIQPKTSEVTKNVNKDPFSDIPVSKNDPISSINKKNDINSIEFLLDLTIPSDSFPTPPAMPSKSINDQDFERLPKSNSPEPSKDPQITTTISENPQKTLSLAPEIQEKDQSKIKPKQSPLNNSEPISKPIIHQENKFKKKIDDQKRKEQEEKEKIEIEKMQKALEEQKKQQEILNPQSLRDSFDLRVKELKDKISHTTTEQCTINEIQLNLDQKVQDMNNNIKEIENLAVRAAENEDFDLAAEYSDKLDEIKLQITFTIKEYERKAEEYLELEFKKSNIYSNLDSVIQGYINKTTELKETIIKDIEIYKKELIDLENDKTSYIEQNSKELAQKKEEIHIIEQSVQEKKQEITQKIYEKTSSLIENKEKIQESVSIIEKEIEDLNKILKEKTENMMAMKTELKEIEEEIKTNTQEFNEEITDNEIAEKLLESEKLSYESAYNNQIIKEKSLSEEISIKSEKILNYNKNLEAFEESLSYLLQESSLISTMKSKREETIENIKISLKSLKEKKELLKEAEEYLETFNKDIRTISEDINAKEERSKELKAQIPLLESEKKAAAVNKQFKVLDM